MLQVMTVRPDEITKTGVINPYSPVDPVSQARSLPGRFISTYRPDGPQVYAAPSTQEIAAAAEAVAVQFRQGKGARVFISGHAKVLESGKQPTGVVWASIWQAAKASATGVPSLVKAWGQPDALVNIVPGSGPSAGALVSMPPGQSGQSAGGRMRENAFSSALGGFQPAMPSSDIPMPVHAPNVAATTAAPSPRAAPFMELLRRQALYTP
jgi:hypothetical protein